MDYYDMPQIDKSGTDYPSLQYVPALSPAPATPLQRPDINKYVGGDILTSCDWTALIHRPADDSETEDLPSTVDTEALKEPSTPLPPPLTPRPPTPPNRSESEDDSSGSDSEPDSSSDSNSDPQEGSEDSSSWSDSDSSESSDKPAGEAGSSSSSGSQSPQPTFSIRETNFEQGGLKLKILATKPKSKLKCQRPESSSSDDSSSGEDSSKEDKKIPDIKDTFESPPDLESQPRDSPPVLEPQTDLGPEPGPVATDKTSKATEKSSVKEFVEPTRVRTLRVNDRPPPLSRPIRNVRKLVRNKSKDETVPPSPKPQARASTRPLRTRKQPEIKSTHKAGLAGSGLRGSVGASAGADGNAATTSDESSSSSSSSEEEDEQEPMALPAAPPIPPSTEPLQVINQEDLAAILPDVGGGGSFDGFEDGRTSQGGAELLPERVPAGSGVTSSSSDVELLPEQEQIVSEAIKRINLDPEIKNVRPPSPHSDSDQMGYSSNLLQQFVEKTEKLSRGETLGEVVTRKRGRPPRGDRDPPRTASAPSQEADPCFMRLDCSQSNVSPDSGIQSVAGSPLHHGMSPSPRSPNTGSVPHDKKESHQRPAPTSHHKTNSSSIVTKDKLSRLHTTRLPIMHLENEKRGPGRPKGILAKKKGKGRRSVICKEKVNPPSFLPPAATQLKVPPYIAGETKAPNLKPNPSSAFPVKRGRGRPKKTPPTLEPVIPISTTKSHRHRKRKKLLKELVLNPEFLLELETLSDQFQKLYISVTLPGADSSKVPEIFALKKHSKKRKCLEKKISDKESGTDHPEVKEKANQDKIQPPCQTLLSNIVKRRPKKAALEPPKSKAETSNEQRLPLKKRHYHISSHSSSLSSEEKTDEAGDAKDLKIVVKSLPYNAAEKHNTCVKSAHVGNKSLHQAPSAAKQSSTKAESLKKEHSSRSSSLETVTGHSKEDYDHNIVKGDIEHESVIVTPKKRHRLEEDRKLTSSKLSLLKEKELGMVNCKRTLGRVISTSSQGRGLSPQGSKRISSRNSTKAESDPKTTQVIKSGTQDSPSHHSSKRSHRNLLDQKHRDSSEEGVSRRNLRTHDMSPSVKETREVIDKTGRPTEAVNKHQELDDTKRSLRNRENSPAVKCPEETSKKEKVKSTETVIKFNQESTEDVPKRSLRVRDQSPALKLESRQETTKKVIHDTISKLQQEDIDETTLKRSLRTRDSSPVIKSGGGVEPTIPSKINCDSTTKDSNDTNKKLYRARDMSPVVKLSNSLDDPLIKKALSLGVCKSQEPSDDGPTKRTLRVRDNSPAVPSEEQSSKKTNRGADSPKHLEKDSTSKRSLRLRDHSPAVKLDDSKNIKIGDKSKLTISQNVSEPEVRLSDSQPCSIKKEKLDVSDPKVPTTASDNLPLTKRKHKITQVTKVDVDAIKVEDVDLINKEKPDENHVKNVTGAGVLSSLSTRSASKLSNVLSVQSLISPIPLVPESQIKSQRYRGDKKPPAGVFEPSVPENDGTPLNIELPELPLKTPPVHPISKKSFILEKPLATIDNNNLRSKRLNEKENSGEVKKPKVLKESLVQDIKGHINDNIVKIVSRAIKMKRKKINRTGFPIKKKKKKKNQVESDVVPPVLEDQRIIPAITMLVDSTPALSPVPKADDKTLDDTSLPEISPAETIKPKAKASKGDDKDQTNEKSLKHDLRPGRRKISKEEDKEDKSVEKSDRPKRRSEVDKAAKQIQADSETESTSVLETKPLPTKRVRRCKDDCDDSDADSVRLRKKTQPRWRKKYLPAGLFSDYFKEEEPGKKLNDGTKVKSAGPDRSEPLLPTPAYCAKWVRQRKLPFQLPYDLWWLHEHNRLPGRDVVPSWNYKKIRTNFYYDVKPTYNYEAQACNCKPSEDSACGDDCINRMVFAECSAQLCPSKEKCSNQKIQRHEWSPGIIKFMTKDKGWGIKTKYSIKNGDFILEYVGEVVSEREFKTRMATRYTEDTHHYCLHLDGGLVIDGHRMGGEGRFVNHSCEPNCEMQKWSVNGLFRMALFALRNIDPNEELTYDYNFSLFNPAEGQPCKCGSTKCRGVIGGKYQKVTPKMQPITEEKSKAVSQVGRPRKNMRKIKAGKKLISKNNVSKDLKVSLKESVGALASVAARLNQVPLKPLSPQQKAFILDNKCFLIRNLEKVNRFRERLKQAMGGGVVETTSAPEPEKPPQPTQSTVKEADVFLAQLQALSCPRNMKTRRLAQAEDNPEMTKTARLACIFKDLYSQVLNAKDESDEVLSSNFITLPSKRKFPLYYRRISNPIDLQTVEQNIVTGVYRSVEAFDKDMNALFKNNVRWYGRTSEPGIAATRLRKIYNVAKLNVLDKVKEIVGEDIPPSFIPQKEDPGGEEEDVIHCICGLFKDEGMMIQCERCLVWQHCDCVTADATVEHYLCERCSPRPVNYEIPFPKQPDYAQPGQFHHVTLLRGDIQIKQADTVYVLRDIVNEESTTVPKSKHTYKTIKNWKYTDCDIFKVERLWKDEKGERFAFGHHFLRPHETYHEPTRKFFPNEVMRVPLYEVVPVELIMGHCFVLDLNTFCKGRPLAASPEHIYICEYRVDKAARVFAKVAKTKQSQICTKSYAFETYDVRLKPQRSYAPHGDAIPSLTSMVPTQPSLTKGPAVVRGRGGRTAHSSEESVVAPKVRQPPPKSPPKRQDKKTRLNRILLKLLGRQPNNKVPLDVSYLLEPGRRHRKKPALLNS